MHPELAFGAIYRAAATAFIDLCAHQLIGRPYRGNPYYNPSGIALLRFISKRSRVDKYCSDDCFGRLWTWWHTARDINGPADQRETVGLICWRRFKKIIKRRNLRKFITSSRRWNILLVDSSLRLRHKLVGQKKCIFRCHFCCRYA